MREFYAGKTVLVTGHTGFKGAWLSLWLARLGARVIGFSLPETEDPSRALFQPKVAVSLAFDVRDHGAVTEAMRAYAPEIVFHLAAQSLVGRSGEDPVGTLAVNVMGTVHVLEAACRTRETRVVLNVTSDKCYANSGLGRPFHEGDRLGGKDPYSASKACSEIVTTAWRESIRQNKVPALATVRAGNVIGGGDWARGRIVPDIVRARTSNKPVLLRHPSAKRPWQHVLDPLRGYLDLARLLYDYPSRYEGAWNFGPDPSQATEVRELARRMLKRWGNGSMVEAPDPSGLPDAASLKLDSSKSKRRLGWRPVFDLDSAIDFTVDWYRRVLEFRENPINVSEEQLAAYDALLDGRTRAGQDS